MRTKYITHYGVVVVLDVVRRISVDIDKQKSINLQLTSIAIQSKKILDLRRYFLQQNVKTLKY